MAVVWIPSLLQRLTDGQDKVSVPGDTLRQVIDNLDARHPGLKARLLDEEGRFPEGIAVAIDGEVQPPGVDRARQGELGDPHHPGHRRRLAALRHEASTSTSHPEQRRPRCPGCTMRREVQGSQGSPDPRPSALRRTRFKVW